MPRKLRADGRNQVYLIVNGTYCYAVMQTTKKDKHTFTLAVKTNLSCLDREIGALEYVSTAHWIDSEGLYGTVLELP